MLSMERSQDAECFQFIMKNTDEEQEGYLRIELIPTRIFITRFYIHGWQQCRVTFHPLQYGFMLERSKDTHFVTHIGGVLTRYCGDGCITLDDGRTIDNFPKFRVDDNMAHAVETICRDYASFMYYRQITTIQRYVRGYLSRRRYNFNQNRMRIIQEIKALPPGAINAFFVGGEDFHRALQRWTLTDTGVVTI